MFCDNYGNKCFNDNMDNAAHEYNCDCPTECNTISYSFTHIFSTPFDAEEFCPRTKGDSFSDDFLMKPFYENKFPPKFVRTLIKFKNNNISDDAVDYCKKNLQYRAVVIIRLATDSMSVTVMSPRLSFFDKMSAFGNN